MKRLKATPKTLLLSTLLLSFIHVTLAHTKDFIYEDTDAAIESVVHTAFVQTGSELHYFSETTVREKEAFTAGDMRGWKDIPTERSLRVTPPSVAFGKTSLGEVVTRKVEICNEKEEKIRVDAVLGDSHLLHSSFLPKDSLSKEECMQLKLAFLPRDLGPRTGPLLVHTSEGVYAIEAEGEVVSNSMRVFPFLGARIPVNGTVSRELELHNPLEWPMRIREISTGGGGLYVELPNGQDPSFSAPLQLWEIPPFQTKHIANLILAGKAEENSTTFAFVKSELVMDNEVKPLTPFYFPMPYETVSSPSVFATSDLMDFGIVKYGDRSRQLIFSAYSTLGRFKEFEVKRIAMEPEELSAIYLEYAGYPPIIITSPRVGMPGVHTPIIRVHFDTAWLPMNQTHATFMRYTGRLTAVGNEHNVSIAYTVGVYTGSLSIESNDGCLHSSLPLNSRQPVRIRSRLPFPVAIYNVSLPVDDAKHLTVRLFNRVVELSPGEVASTFLVKYIRKVPETFSTEVTIHTNVTTFTVPIEMFDGKLDVKLHSNQQKSFDFGVMERNDTRRIKFEVHNRNSATISLLNVRLPFPENMKLSIIGKQSLNKDMKEIAHWNLEAAREVRQGVDVSISARSAILLEVVVRAGVTSEKGQFILHTDFETHVFPFTYEVSKGRLVPIPPLLKFGPTHPGKISYRWLQMFNSFEEDMIVDEVHPPRGDMIVHLEGLSYDNQPPVLKTGRVTNLGRVLVMPPIECTHNTNLCYLGMHIPTPVNLPADLGQSSLTDGQWFAHGMTLPTNLADIDAYLYKRARSKFEALVDKGRHLVNTSLILHTHRAKHIEVPLTTELVWPRLLTRSSIQFPLTAVGNFTIVNLTLSNPSSEPVIVQLIPLVIYPDAEAFVEAFKDHLNNPLTSHVEMNETLMFSLRDTELFTLRPESPVPMLREGLEKKLGMNVPRFTLSAILEPHMKMRIRLGFLPSDYSLRSTILVIRNNLTMVEPVVVYGRGARMAMEVDGYTTRGRKPLLFEIRQDHLHDCENPRRLTHRLTSTLTVRRPFNIVNTGEVPFHVVNMSISNIPCENRGFRILNCFPFRLSPNETYSLDVAYTPDFLSSTNEADLQLYMHMNGSAWLFPLAATVPEEMLSTCHAALPRPPFEHIMYYCCLIALVFCLICVIACAYLEGDRAVICALRSHYGIATTVFDLNAPPHMQQSTASKYSSRPTELSAGTGAGIHKRIFVAVANCVVYCVHLVWSITLRWRKETNERTRVDGTPTGRQSLYARSRMDWSSERRLRQVEGVIDGDEKRRRRKNENSTPTKRESRRKDEEVERRSEPGGSRNVAENEPEDTPSTSTQATSSRNTVDTIGRTEDEATEGEEVEEVAQEEEQEVVEEEENREEEEEEEREEEEENAEEAGEVEEGEDEEENEEDTTLTERQISSGEEDEGNREEAVVGEEEKEEEREEDEGGEGEGRGEESSEQSEAPEWDDVEEGDNVDDHLTNLVQDTANAFPLQRETEESPKEKSPVHVSPIGSERRQKEEEMRRKRMEEEKKKREEEMERREEERRERVRREMERLEMERLEMERRERERMERERREQERREAEEAERERNSRIQWALPPIHIPNLETTQDESHSSAWPPPSSPSSWPPPPPSLNPPPGLEHLTPSFPPPPVLPSLNFGTIFAGADFNRWGVGNSASGWDPFMKKEEEKKKKEE